MLRELAENTGAKIGSGVVVLGLASNGKASSGGRRFAGPSEDACTPARSSRRWRRWWAAAAEDARILPRRAAKTPEKLDEALQAVYNIVAELTA